LNHKDNALEKDARISFSWVWWKTSLKNRSLKAKN